MVAMLIGSWIYSFVLFNCRYPYNNFLHHHVENIIFSCLESKNPILIGHVLRECNLVGKILEAEKNFTLVAGPGKVITGQLKYVIVLVVVYCLVTLGFNYMSYVVLILKFMFVHSSTANNSC